MLMLSNANAMLSRTPVLTINFEMTDRRRRRKTIPEKVPRVAARYARQLRIERQEKILGKLQFSRSFTNFGQDIFCLLP